MSVKSLSKILLCDLLRHVFLRGGVLRRLCSLA